jgi:hypothetical protein
LAHIQSITQRTNCATSLCRGCLERDSSAVDDRFYDTDILDLPSFDLQRIGVKDRPMRMPSVWHFMSDWRSNAFSVSSRRSSSIWPRSKSTTPSRMRHGASAKRSISIAAPYCSSFQKAMRISF